ARPDNFGLECSPFRRSRARGGIGRCGRGCCAAKPCTALQRYVGNTTPLQVRTQGVTSLFDRLCSVTCPGAPPTTTPVSVTFLGRPRPHGEHDEQRLTRPWWEETGGSLCAVNLRDGLDTMRRQSVLSPAYPCSIAGNGAEMWAGTN